MSPCPSTRPWMVAALLTGSLAQAGVGPDFDVHLAHGPRPALHIPQAPVGHQVRSVDERLGVPRLLFAPRTAPHSAGGLNGSLRAQGVTAREAALQHLAGVASAYHRAPAAALGLLGASSVHDAGGPVIVSYEQQVDGVRLFRERVAVVMTPALELVAVSGHFTPHDHLKGRFVLGASTAVATALFDLTGQLIDPAELRERGLDEGGYQRLSLANRPGLQLGSARATQVAYELPKAAVPAWYVELDASDGTGTTSDAVAYVVSATTGELLSRVDLTAQDAYGYRVWAETTAPYLPFDGPAGTGLTPHPTGLPDYQLPPFLAPNKVTLQNSPYSKNDPWLPSAASELKGNNAEAYADLVAPDGYGTGDFKAAPSSPANFDFTYDLAQPPGAATQRSAALTQLFFDANFLHDWFYDHGFDEAAGNAQEDNFGRGGTGGDSLRLEAQDYSGTNNANMTTPADGARPRMQMFVWALAALDVKVTAPVAQAGKLPAAAAQFGPTTFSVSGDLVAAVDPSDASGPSVSDGCSAFTNAAAVSGKVALIERGTCAFPVKVKNAQNAGAIGVVVADTATALAPPVLGGTDATILIPTLSVRSVDGAALRSALGTGPVTLTLEASTLNRDGDLDNTIVAHEWGHYLSGRLIGNGVGLSVLQARGMNEGWSDFVALLTVIRASDQGVPSNATWNGVYGLAGYAMGTTAPGNSYYFGVRRFPYSTDFTKNALTFKHIQEGVALPATPTRPMPMLPANSEVHATGEVWCTMLWEVAAAFLRDGRFTFDQARSRLLDYLVAADKLTPANPSFTEARDAWLAVTAARDLADYALVGQAFARRGLGTAAVAPPLTSTNNQPVTEDFGFTNQLVLESASLTDDVRSCDHDGVLDVGEVGTLTLSFRNVGAGALSNSSATIAPASGTSGVTVVTPTLTLPGSSPQGLTTATTQLSVTGKTQPTVITLTVSWTDPALPAGTRTQDVSFRVQADAVAANSATDDFEVPIETWNSTRKPTGTSFGWTRATLSPVQHVYRGLDPSALVDLALVTPPLTVSTSAPLVMTLTHRYSFESNALGDWDGAVIEVSTDDGASWTDLGAAANYPGSLTSTDNTNPLAGQPAFMAQNAGYPAFITSTITLGSTYAGKTVRLRFRVATDDNGGDSGWDLDSVGFSGITNTPFPSLVADRHQCTGAPTVSLPATDTAPERTAKTLTATASAADGGVLTYAWSQLSGPVATLDVTTAASLSFTVPEVTRADVQAMQNVAVFQVVVSAGAVSSTAQERLTITDVNRPPSVEARATGAVQPGAVVTLTATASDPDGDPLSYDWTQLDGGAVVLADGGLGAVTTFTVGSQPPGLFQVTVSDGVDATTATVAVGGAPLSPVIGSCGCASATGPELLLAAWAAGVLLARRRASRGR